MGKIKYLISSIGSGVCIGVGCTVYLSLERNVLGAFLFSLGLITIISFGLGLFTGKVGYIPDNKPAYFLDLIVIWIGNFIGTFVSASAISVTRVYPKLMEQISFVDTKTTDSPISLFVLSMFCGMLMYIAVETYRLHGKEENTMSTVVAVFCVAVFILAGFEHCIADMFYFTLYNHWDKTLLPLMIITIGNGCGGVFINLLKNMPREIKG